MKKYLSHMNPMLLNLLTGCLVYGAAAGIILGMVSFHFYPQHCIRVMLGYVCGLLLAVLQLFHMYRGLLNTLSYGEEKSALWHSRKMYGVRIVAVLAAFYIIWFLAGTECLIFAVLGMMSLKVAAYLQPFTDKFFVSKIYK
jgi:hypothetical protein